MALAKSDMIFYAPEGALAERLERIRELARPRLELSADYHIVPGQPLKVTWKFNRLVGGGPLSVTARFLVDGHTVRERHGVGTTDTNLGTQRETDEVLLPPQLYRFGFRRLELEIYADGGRIARLPHNFEVRRAGVDSGWWRWREGKHVVDWKHEYTLSADFFNGWAFATIETLEVALYEVRDDDDPLIDPCYYGDRIATEQRSGIAARTTTSFTFPRMHDWEWITPTAFVVHGPMDKSFSYAVEVRLTDQYGNVYGYRDMEGTLHPVFCSIAIGRSVNVSVAKAAAGAVAMSAAVDAAVLTVAAFAALAGIFTAFGAPALFAAAGIAYGIAHAAHEQAEDPPEPDENFRAPVIVGQLDLPSWPESLEPELRPLREFFDAAARVFALERARTTTRARMMGARLFNDDQALARQRDGYLRIERELSEVVAAAREVLPELQQVVELSEAFDPVNLRLWLDTLASGAIPTRVRAAMLDAGLTASGATALQSLVLNRTITEILRANGLFLAPFAENLEAIVRGVQSEREMILAGEEVCPPSRRPTRRQDDVQPDDPQTRPPVRRGRCRCGCCC